MSKLNFYEVEGNFISTEGTDVRGQFTYQVETPRQAIRIARWRDGLNLDAEVSMRKLNEAGIIQ